MSRRGPVLDASGSRSQRQEGDHSNSFSSNCNSAFYSYPSTSYHPIQHLQFHSINPSNHPQSNQASFSFSTASSSSFPPSHPSSKPRPSSCHTQELHSPTYISSSNQSHNLSLSCTDHPEGIEKEPQSQMMTYPSAAAAASQVQLKHQGQQQASTVPPHPSTYSQTGILPPLRTSSPDGNSYRSYSYEEPILQHHRNLSLSSQPSLPTAPCPSTSSHSLQPTPNNDLSDSWSSLPTSTRSRTGSTFSLTGHLEGMGMSNGSGTDSPPLNPNPSQFPIRTHLPHLYSNDRRSSLDDRSVAINAPIRNFSWDNYSRDPPQIPTPPNLNLSQTGGGNNSRNWPWPAAPLHLGYGGPHLRHSSVSGAPIQYEPHYSRAGGMGGIVGGVGSNYQHSFPQPTPLVGGHHHQEWMSDGNQMGNGLGMGGSASSVGRIRSASGSAMGRFAQHPYGMGMDPVDCMDQNSIDPLYSSNPSTSSLSTSTSKATGTGTPRRTKFRRSRTGCIMCRKRKVKCSQDGSPCKQCRTGKRECVYEAVPPKRKRTTKKSTAAVAPTVQSQEMSNSETVSSSDTNGYHDLRRLSTATAGTDASSSSPSSGSLANHSGVYFTMPFDSTAGSAGTGWSGTPPPPLANSIHSGSPTSNDSHSQSQPHYTLSSIHDPASHVMPSANPPAVDARYQSSASYHPPMHHQSIHSASSHLGHNPTAPYYHSEYIPPLEPPSNYASSGYAGSDAAYSMESARSR